MEHLLRIIYNIFGHTACFAASLVFITTGLTAQTFITEQNGKWTIESTWVDDVIPRYDGNLSNQSEINIHHDVQLVDKSFETGNNTNMLDIFVGDGTNAVTLTVDRDFTISKTIDLVIEEGSTLQVGIEHEDPLFDYCDDEYSGDYQWSLFKVEGSNQDPTLHIKKDATFILYGDFEVENKFNIIVEEGGRFIVKGSFDAGNSAEVTFSGAGGEVGCDMNFDNGAEVNLDVGTLWVGGDMNFGNSGDINLSGSELVVNGGICSSEGQGSGAVINLTGNDNNPSSISAGSICEHTFGDLDEYDNIDIDDNFLPIDLLSFDAKVKSSNVILNWITASEVNNDYFTIERSRDLTNWEVVGMIKGSGTTSIATEYSLTDFSPLKGVSYYRLKQTDFDGSFEYFAPQAVTTTKIAEELDFKVLKNPDSWTVALPDEQVYQVEVYTLSGYKIFTGSGSHNLSFPNPKQTVVIRIMDHNHYNTSRVVM